MQGEAPRKRRTTPGGRGLLTPEALRGSDDGVRRLLGEKELQTNLDEDDGELIAVLSTKRPRHVAMPADLTRPVALRALTGNLPEPIPPTGSAISPLQSNDRLSLLQSTDHPLTISDFLGLSSNATSIGNAAFARSHSSSTVARGGGDGKPKSSPLSQRRDACRTSDARAAIQPSSSHEDDERAVADARLVTSPEESADCWVALPPPPLPAIATFTTDSVPPRRVVATGLPLRLGSWLPHRLPHKTIAPWPQRWQSATSLPGMTVEVPRMPPADLAAGAAHGRASTAAARSIHPFGFRSSSMADALGGDAPPFVTTGAMLPALRDAAAASSSEVCTTAGESTRACMGHVDVAVRVQPLLGDPSSSGMLTSENAFEEDNGDEQPPWWPSWQVDERAELRDRAPAALNAPGESPLRSPASFGLWQRRDELLRHARLSPFQFCDRYPLPSSGSETSLAASAAARETSPGLGMKHDD